VFAASRDGRQKPYCKPCFQQYIDLAVRDAFFRHCGVPTDVPVVIAVSGGAGSMALLDVCGRIRRGNLERGGAGRIVYDLRVLHVTESGVAVMRDEDDVQHAERVAELVSACAAAHGLPCTTLPLLPLVGEAAVARIHGSASLTDREDLFHTMRRNAILNAATSMGANAVVFGDTATTCAWRSLGEFVRGRGENVRNFYGYHALLPVGPRRELFLFRPMRGVLAKEAALYCRASSIPATYLPAPATKTSLRSVDRALEAFVTQLEITFRSTVFNVLNAVDRIGPQPDAASLNRGSSTVTNAAGGGKRALKQHLHEVIMSTLRAATKVGRRPRDDSAASDDEERCRTCGVCGAVLKAHRTEGGLVAGNAATSAVCYGCRPLLALADVVDSFTAGSVDAGSALGQHAVTSTVASSSGATV
jgi:tRNA(Ile)-lysidine synthase TilS/MesJ